MYWISEVDIFLRLESVRMTN